MGKKDRGAFAIEEVAKKRNLTVEEVRKEMQKEIMCAYENKESKDRWNKIFGENVIPTPEEFIMKLEEMLESKMQ